MDHSPADGVALRVDIAIGEQLLIDVGAVHHTKATGRQAVHTWLTSEARYERQAHKTGGVNNFRQIYLVTTGEREGGGGREKGMHR